MGAYLSEPKITKDSSDYNGDRLRCGASSMQGWRTSQEDAHNCILEFDKNVSLFAVYDGHGGHEVAEYCSKKLPDFIKQTESYIKRDYEQALKDAFLGFDATLITPEVVSELSEIAGSKDKENLNSDEDRSESEGEEAIDHLVQEAHMPLDEVMAKYKTGVVKGVLARIKGEGRPPVSPMLRARRTPCSSSSEVEEGPSSSGASSSGIGDGEVSSSCNHGKAPVICNGDVHINGEGDSKTDAEVKSCVNSTDDSVTQTRVGQSESVKKLDGDERTVSGFGGVSNGESPDVTSSTGNGDSGASSKVSEEITGSSPPKKKIISSMEIYQKLLQDDSDSEEEDETFVADGESEDSSDEAADESADKEELGNEEEEESSVEEEEDEEDCCEDYSIKEVPGSDSGSTAVVALLVDNQLFVANAGDSRCVVCHDGVALDMSLDHKPEDEPEKRRIEIAGGIVSGDGRVNGGLNLSRAIGDHSYKKNKDIPLSEQMITACPDVRTVTVDPEVDKFMVLACDGIWNSMTSQEVVDFVNTKLELRTERLSQICEELFDHCLAPDTMGDGTGCDNMTCVLVQFIKSDQDHPKVHVATASVKRTATEEAEEPDSKRSKVEQEVKV